MLQPDKLKKLNENATKMSEAGSSQDDILAMKDAFIKQFGIEEPLKKKDGTKAPLSSTTPTESTELVPKDGSLDTTKPPKFKLEGQKTIVPETEQKNLYDLKQNKPEEIIVDKDAEFKKPTLPKEKRGFISETIAKMATGSSQLGADIASTPELIYDVFSAPQNYIAKKFNIPSLATDAEKLKENIGVENVVKDFYQQEVKNLRQESELVDKKYQQGIYDSFKSGDYEDGFRQLTNSFAESLPATTSIMVGGAYTKAPQLLAATTMVFGAGKSEKLKEENPEMETNTRVANALATGLAQGAFETVGSGSIGSAAKALVEREGIKKGAFLLKDGLVNFYKESLKKNPMLASMSGEGIEEWATTITENSIDVVTGVKPPDFNVFEGSVDSLIGGIFGGAIFGGGLKGIDKIASSKDKDVVKQNFKKTFELQKQLENPDVSEPVKKEIEKAIGVITKENQAIIIKNVNNADNLPQTVKEKLSESVNKLDEIKQKVNDVKLDQNTSDASKQILLDSLKKEFEEAQQMKSDIIDGKISEVDVLPIKQQDKIKLEALKELTTELNPEGTKDITITNEQVLERANKLYTEQKDAETQITTADTKVKSETEVQEQPEAEKVDGNYIFEGKEYIVKDGSMSDIDGNLFPITFDGNSKYENVISKGKKIQPQEISLVEDVVAPSVEKKNSPWDIVSKEEVVYREKQQRGKDKAINDIELINSGDKSTIDAYFKKSGYKEITNNEQDIRLKGKEGKFFRSTGASIIVKNTKADVAIDTAINVSNKKIKGLPNSRIEEIVKNFESEKLSPTNTPTNGNIQPTTEQVAEVGVEGKPTAEVIETESVESAIEPRAIEETPKVKKYKLTDKGQAFNVERKNGVLTVTKQDGNSVSKPTERAVLRKHADQVDFTQGKKASEIENFTPSEETITEQIADLSENPVEIAEEIQRISIKNPSELSFEERQDFKEQIIAEEISAIEAEGFFEFGDRKQLSNFPVTSKAYFKEGGRKIDDLATEMSEQSGMEITPSDIADFIIKYQKGKKDRKAKGKEMLSQEQINQLNQVEDLKKKFTKLTGFEAKQEFLLKAIEQANRKSELNSSLDEMTDAELIELDKTINQIEKEIYGEVKQVTKGVDKGKGDKVSEQEPIVQKELTRKEKRINAIDAKIDDLANALKDLLPSAPDTNGLKKQGLSQDDLIDFIAKNAKILASATITIDEAIRQVIDHLKSKGFDVDVNVDDVKKVVEPEVKTQTIDVEINEPLPISETFSKSASTVPNSGEVGEYLSGKTIEKYTGEQAENDQTIQRVKLLDALRHGVNTIEIAKLEFGDQFVEKTLEFLDNNNVSIEAKALTYISLENELNKQKLENPQDRSRIQKQLNLVRVKRQAFARSNSLALNMNRLQAFAKVGYDINEATDKMFSSKEKEARNEIESAIQANGDQINDEAVVIEEEGFLIEEPKVKRDKATIKSEISDVVKKMRADLIRAAKGQTLNVSIPYAEQIKVATPHIIKLTKLFSELGGLKTKEIIDAVYEEIQSVFPSLKRKDVSNIVKEEYQQKPKSPRDIKMRDLVKQALIEAGYSREVKTKGEIKTYFDWKKLAGEEGSVDNIKEVVERVLKSKGYSESQISEMADLLKNEYEDLRASIVEKSIRELQNRNTIKPTANVKGIAKKLAELYNYGLFEDNMDTYNNLLNSALGFDKFQQEQFDKLTEYGRALSILFGAESSLTNGKKLSELAVKTQANEINRQIKIILRNAQFKNAPAYFKVATIIRDFVNISLTSKLMSVKQIIENPMSGFTERQFQNIGNMFNVKENGELKANRKKLSKYVYSDIVRNGGLFYGDVSNTLVSQSAVEDWLNKQSDNRIYHSVVSALLGRAYLNGADSMNKALLTEKNFEYNLVKILNSDSNPQGKMSKDDAMKFVAEKITGQNFTEAQKIASDLIEKVNLDAGKQIIPNNTENKFRFAMDIVKESLAVGTELSLDQVEKAYNAGYKSAGFAIGHEANNPISLISNMGSARIEGLLDKAVKEKKWAEASMYSVLSTVVKGVINPFVGGSFNWMTLTLQKAGLDPVSIFADIVRKKDNPIDLSTQTGINNLQNALVRDTNLKNTYNRYLIGAGVSIIIASASVASGADDDMESWLKKNEWARKYFNVISPPALLLLMSVKNEDLGDYLTKLLNVKVDNMDANVKILKSIDKEDQSTFGAFGQIIGQPFDTPVPWRVFRDIDNIKRGMSGRPLVKSTFKTNGFWNGYFQGGLVDYSGFRPGENYKTKEKIQQVRQETEIYNEKVKQLAKDYVNEKYSEKELNEKINKVFSEEPLKAEKTKNIFKNKAKDEAMKKQVKDQFYIDLKRESNDEIKAIMMYDKFGDLSTLSDDKIAELTKNMNIINFNPSDEFWTEYYKLLEIDKKAK